MPVASDDEPSCAAARAVADAVLYEGYLLYPYRRSSEKNRMRWQFGVLAPRDWVTARQSPSGGDGPATLSSRERISGAAEAWRQRTECLLAAGPSPRLWVRLRFLQVQHRAVCRAAPGGGWTEVDALEVAGERHLTFDEALPHERLITPGPGERRHRADLSFAGGATVERLGGPAAIVRTREPLSARVEVTLADAGPGLCRLRVDVCNTASGPAPGAPRQEALRVSLIATHCLLGVRDGAFLSLLDPPASAAGAAAGCRNEHTFPVLAGEPGSPGGVVLSSPIILYDHPVVAPQSPGELFDACEIDEILTLRTLTLTDAEKSEARATDPRARSILDRVHALPPEALARLHGVLHTHETTHQAQI